MNADKRYLGGYVLCLRADESSLVRDVPCCVQQIVQYMAAKALIRRNWVCLSSTCAWRGKAARHTFLGTAEDDWCPYCTSCVKNTRHPSAFLLLYFIFFVFFHHLFYFLQLLEGSKGKRGDWQLSRSQSINRHVSRNSAITFHCSPLEHVEDMNSWCRIPSVAPDVCDAIGLAELGCLTEQ